MFGFSVQKLLVLAAIIALVWFGFRWVGRLQEMRAAEQKAARRTTAKRKPAAEDKRAADPAEEMVQCPACQAYVPVRDATSCGRADCPY